MTKNISDFGSFWLAPTVIAARMPILIQEALTKAPGARHETNRMMSEKLVATQQGIVAAQLALGQAMVESWAALAFGQISSTTPQRTAQAMIQAGMAPAARKVRANVKRLSHPAK